MASLVYNKAAAEIADQTVDLLNDNIDLILVSSATAYTPDVDDELVDAGGANDVIDAETNVSGYTKGWGNEGAGTGRCPLAGKAITTDDTNDQAEFDANDPAAWTLATGETVVAAVVCKRGSADDTDARLIAYLDFTDTPTNGGTFTLTFGANGFIQWQTT